MYTDAYMFDSDMARGVLLKALPNKNGRKVEVVLVVNSPIMPFHVRCSICSC
jgi:hypothetical protein